MEFEMHVTKGKLISEKWNFFPSFWVERDGVAWSRRKIKNSFLENKKKKDLRNSTRDLSIISCKISWFLNWENFLDSFQEYISELAWY